MSGYVLYWHPQTSSYAPHVVLEEIGVNYETKFVDYEASEQKSESFLAINPNGMLPVLLLEDGRSVYESAAIVMYLSDRHSEANLAPGLSEPDRPFYNQWLFYLSSMVFQTYTRYYQSDRYSTDPTNSHPIREQAARDLVHRWQIVDRALMGKSWLLGSRFSVCDIYMQMLTLWHLPREGHDPNSSPMLSDAFFDRFENVTRVAAAVGERPATKKIMALYPQQDYFSSTCQA